MLCEIYALAAKGVFDPYNWLTGLAAAVAYLGDAAERGIRWLFDEGLIHGAHHFGGILSRLDSGEISLYIGMAFFGLAGMAFILMLYAV